MTAADGQNPTGHADETQVSGTALFPETPLSDPEGVCLEIRDKRLAKDTFHNLRDDRRQVNTPIIPSVIYGSLFINRDYVVNSPSCGPPCFIENPPAEDGER